MSFDGKSDLLMNWIEDLRMDKLLARATCSVGTLGMHRGRQIMITGVGEGVENSELSKTAAKNVTW